MEPLEQPQEKPQVDTRWPIPSGIHNLGDGLIPIPEEWFNKAVPEEETPHDQ